MSKHKTRQIARISEATLHLIHDEGLSGLSMSNIAQAAGVTRQTIYNYFPDVQSIIAQALKAHSIAAEGHLLQIIEAADSPRAKLCAFARFQITHASPRHKSISLEAGLSAETRSQLDLYANPVKKTLVQIIKSGKTSGDISAGIDPVIASELLWEITEGAANVAAKYPEKKAYLLDATVNAMWAALHD